jgi:stage V sporulation protein G
MFVAMPSYKAGNKYKDVCFPITKEFREKVNNAVLETYHQAKEQAVQEGQERASQQMQTTDDRGFMKVSGEPLPFR